MNTFKWIPECANSLKLPKPTQRYTQHNFTFQNTSLSSEYVFKSFEYSLKNSITNGFHSEAKRYTFKVKG